MLLLGGIIVRRLLDSRDRSAGPRIGRAHLDPRDKRLNLLGRKRLAGRHLQIFVRAFDHFDQKTLFRLARHDGGSARFAAAQQTVLRIGEQSA